ncbi:MAG: cytochrome ubiquinol oxidase subunit I [Rhodocyclaceae bacterium]|nr:cytochrome ubiquinol oxidase subunit I [Rhodocyclaceae bacterium]
MDTLDAIALARAQFALNIGFHILFPSITIALSWLLLWFRLQYARSGAPHWLAAYKLWTRVFALSFAMGVVTGIVMSFQFGTNWPNYMNRVGNVAGPLLAYEVLTAFFLEATFLGVMLFGMARVPAWLHVVATALVALGTTLSAFWILALDSWMQTPTGHVMRDGKLIAGNWWAVIFNPSLPYRFCHMLVASGLTVSFLVAGLSAWRLLRAPDDAAARRTLRLAVSCAALLAPLQIFVGDQHGLNTLEHQPAKVAAIEALWHTQRGAPLVLFAVPDERTQHNDFALEVPRGASLILRHALDGELKGLDAFAPDVAPVAPVFFAFRIMVGMGVAMLALSWFGVLRLRREPPPRWLLWLFAGFTFSGWIAVLAGWVVTESGRQPWLVTGVLRTVDAAGNAAAAQLGASLTGYVVTYAIMLLAYIVVLTHLAGGGAIGATPAAVPAQPS